MAKVRVQNLNLASNRDSRDSGFISVAVSGDEVIVQIPPESAAEFEVSGDQVLQLIDKDEHPQG